MISVDEAFQHYKLEISSLPMEDVSRDEALGRVLAKEVYSEIDLPPFPQSAMDGFALRAEDTKKATPERSVRLRLTGEIQAGRLSKIPQLQSGEAMRIFTGGYVPQGADAILRQEDAQVKEGWLLVHHALLPGTDLRGQGEEVPKHERLATAGTRLTAGHLAAFAIAGVGRVSIHREPRIAILTTGDEVVTVGNPLAPGEVYDSNTPLVTSWLRSQGYTHIDATHLPDDLKGTEKALGDAFAGSDLVITAGGVSVGERDFIMKAAQSVGVREVFWKVRQKPGKPLFFGMLNEKPLLGLPGNPGSVFVCLVTHVRRVLDLLEGVSPPGPIFHMGRLREPLESASTREWWVRCRLESSPDGGIGLVPLPHQSSHMITNLTECTAVACLPEGVGALQSGSVVSWTPV